MKGYNQVDPNIYNQATILGQQQEPTADEIKTMERNALTIAAVNISGTAISSLLESNGAFSIEEASDISFSFAKSILDKSDETKDDYGDEVGKRKVRNQLAAQICFALLKGHPPSFITTDGPSYEGTKKYVDSAFKIASNMLERSQEYAIQKVDNEESSTT